MGQNPQKGNEDSLKYLRRIHMVKIRVRAPEIANYSADLVAVFLCPQLVSDFEHEIGPSGSPRHCDSVPSACE